MKINKLTFFFTILMLSNALAEVPVTPPASFGGGINVKTNSSDIDDAESPDMSNMISDIYGSSLKRQGSSRYINQATSPNPFKSLYRVYQTSGTGVIKALIGASGDRLYASTTITPSWVVISSGNKSNQNYEFVTMRNKLIWTGDGLTDPIRQYDVAGSSLVNLIGIDASSESITIRAKHIFQSKNYFLAGNVRDVGLFPSTTDYPSRVYFSLLNNPSSMTALRYIDFRADDGEQVNAISELNGRVQVWKETSIAEIAFNTLNLDVLGGDKVVTQIVNGFGLFAIKTLANLGDFYIFGSRDGLRLWDGGRKTRLSLDQESRVISLKIKPIIDRCIRAGTWKNAVGKFYPRKNWYLLSIEDPERNPRGRNNSIYAYDLNTSNWYRFLNWNAESFASFDGTTDLGELVYGDLGYVYQADNDLAKNDARFEIAIDPMDNQASWTRGTQDTVNILEGTGSIKLTVPDAGGISSTTLMQVINVSEWPDKSKVTKADKLSFKVLFSSIQNLQNVRMDLEINSITGDFDNNFTSVTFSSNSIVASSATLFTSNTNWFLMEVPISSFPILDSWGKSISTEAFPFGNNLLFYGVRFAVNGVAGLNASFDDLRLVGQKEAPLNAYRYTRQWNFGTATIKNFKQIVLNAEVSGDSNYFMDISNNFGEFSRRRTISGGFGKDLYVAGYNGTNNVTRLSSIDFSFLQSTIAAAQSNFAVRPLTVDERYIYAGDHYNNRILKIDKSSPTVLVSSYGSLGSGSTNFNLIYQMAVDADRLYISDFANQRIKVHKKDNLQFVKSFGSLGNAATSFHNVTGVAVDGTYLYLGNDGNSNLLKIDKSSGGFVASAPLNLTTVGDTTLAVDEQYLYDAYNTVSSTSVDHQDIVLEKRYKSSLELINKVLIRPVGISQIAISSYALQGDISISDDYIYISFTDNIVSGTGNYFIQKLSKSDFSIIKEYKSANRHFAVAANGLAFRPKRQTLYMDLGTTGEYLQLKFSDMELDNNMKLYNQAFILEKQEDRNK